MYKYSKFGRRSTNSTTAAAALATDSIEKIEAGFDDGATAKVAIDDVEELVPRTATSIEALKPLEEP